MRGVGPDHDQVGAFARFEGANLLLQTQGAGAFDGGHGESRLRRQRPRVAGGDFL